MIKSVLFAMIVVAYLATGEAIKCYQCHYPETLECGSEFKRDGVGVLSVECDPLATKCAKYVFGPNVTRDCDVTFPAIPDSPDGEPEDYYCEIDLCNGVSSIDVALSTLMALVSAFILASQK